MKDEIERMFPDVSTRTLLLMVGDAVHKIDQLEETGFHTLFVHEINRKELENEFIRMMEYLDLHRSEVLHD